MGVKKELWINSPFFPVLAVLPRGFRGPKIVKVLYANVRVRVTSYYRQFCIPVLFGQCSFFVLRGEESGARLFR